MNKCKYLLPCGRCNKFDKKCKMKLKLKNKNSLEPIMQPKFINESLPSGICSMY
jgi:hypothetical protein